MDDVKQTLKPLVWSSAIQVVDKSSVFPMLVKPTPLTAEKYGISKDPVLLHHFWITQRIVAQNIELEGTYVVGPQMEISSDYTGTFQYRHDQKGNSDIVQVFSCVKDIASCMPEKVFAQERLVVYPASSQDLPPNGEKVKSLVLQPREQLTVLGKHDVIAHIPASRVPFGFGGKTRFKQVSVPCVSFYNETSKDVLNLPLSTKGRFCTLSYVPAQGREFDFRDILHEIDVPINVTTCRNCPQTLLDEHFLRPGMRLRLTSIEEHEVILGVTTQEKIVEFASDGVEFILPKHLDSDDDREQEIAYQTALQRFLMECQIKNSAVNMKDYRKSIRNHVSRTVSLTNPKPLSLVASYRDSKFVMPSASAQNGLPAIAFLATSTQSPLTGHRRRSSLPNDGTSRPAMPLPEPPSKNSEPTPPLPPRNLRLTSSVHVTPRPYSMFVADQTEGDFPLRPPPPLPPSEVAPSLPERPKSHSVSSGTDSKASAEDVWEKPDESCLQRLRMERSSSKKRNYPSPYEDSSDLMKQSTATPLDSLDISTLNPSVALNGIERSPSPEFTRTFVPPNTPYTTPASPLQDHQVDGFQNSVESLASQDGESDGPYIPSRTTSLQEPEHDLSSLRQVDGQEKSVESFMSEEDKNNGPSIPSRTTSLQARMPVDGVLVNTGSTSSNSESRVMEIEKLIHDQTVEASTAETDHPPESQYENWGQPSSSEQEASHDVLDGSIEESGSPPPAGSESSRSSARSTPSVLSNAESESNEKTYSKSSPSSSRSSMKQKNGFHMSTYSVVSDDSNPSLQHISFTCNYIPSPTDWTPPADLSTMTVNEVADSMRYIGMNEDTVEWFKAEKVDGQLLCLIEDDAITEHFRLSPFQRKKLAMFLKGWRPKMQK